MSNAKAGETSIRNWYISCDDAWYNFNHKYSRDGHLFRERFKSEPVNDMAYFETLLRYIHQNPVMMLIKEMTGVTDSTAFQQITSRYEEVCINRIEG